MCGQKAYFSGNLRICFPPAAPLGHVPCNLGGHVTGAEMKLRSYLLALGLITVLPLLIFSVVMTASSSLEHLAIVKEGLIDTSRAISMAIDRRLTGSIDVLEALANSNALDAGDLEKFRQEAERVLAAHDSWSVLTVVSPPGKRLFDLGQPPTPEWPSADDDRFF